MIHETDIFGVIDGLQLNYRHLFLCKCGKPAPDSPRQCPYDAEVNNDIPQCPCCDECAQEYKDMI